MIGTRTKRARKRPRRYDRLGCPLTRHQSLKCFRTCLPGDDDRGPCGRVAPHSIKSRIQLAIETHRSRQMQGHCR